MAEGFIIRQATLFESFNNISDWTNVLANSSIEATSNGLQLITVSNGGSCYCNKTISADLSKAGTFKVTVYIASQTDMANLGGIDIFISSTTDFSKYFHKSFSSTALHEGMNEIFIGRDQWVNAFGDESWANTMIRLRVRVNAAVTKTAVLTYCSIYYSGYTRAKVLIQFDDTRTTNYTQGYNYMKKYRMRGTAYANMGLLSSSSQYMSLANLTEMYNAGWDVCNHTDTHPHLDQSDSATVATELDNCYNSLLANNFIRNNCHKHFAYPYGGYNDAVRAALAQRGYLTARSTKSPRGQAHDLDAYDILACQYVHSTDTLADLEAAIDRTISEGGALFLLFHMITTSPAQDIEFATADFQSLIDYIQSKRSQIDVITITEWYAGLIKPRKTTQWLDI